MAKFHSEIETINEGYATPKMVKEQIDDLGNFRETIKEACGMEKEVDEVLERCGKFILENKLLFKKRIKDGRIKDCHGDLHSGNIFLGEKIFVFDCIEFNKDFRVNDVASEMAFMAMDLDYFGREDLSKILVDEYIKLTKDEEIRKIIGLYKCYRANVRAKVAAMGYMQNPDDENKEKIRKYLELAKEYSKEI